MTRSVGGLKGREARKAWVRCGWLYRWCACVAVSLGAGTGVLDTKPCCASGAWAITAILPLHLCTNGKYACGNSIIITCIYAPNSSLRRAMTTMLPPFYNAGGAAAAVGRAMAPLRRLFWKGMEVRGRRWCLWACLRVGRVMEGAYTERCLHTPSMVRFEALECEGVA